MIEQLFFFREPWWAILEPWWLVLFLFLYICYRKWVPGVDRQMRRYALLTLLLFYVVVGSPLAVPAERHLFFSAYMFQQSLLCLVIPPLLLKSFPLSSLRPYLWHYFVKKICRGLTHPITTTVLFNVGFSVVHVPFIFHQLLYLPSLFFLIHVFIFLSAVLMWWSILSPLPELNQLTEGQRIAYIFINGVALSPLCIFLLLSSSPLYPAYAHKLFYPSFTAVYDQQLAGGLLKSIQLTSYGIALGVIVFRWVKKKSRRHSIRKKRLSG